MNLIDRIEDGLAGKYSGLNNGLIGLIIIYLVFKKKHIILLEVIQE